MAKKTESFPVENFTKVINRLTKNRNFTKPSKIDPDSKESAQEPLPYEAIHEFIDGEKGDFREDVKKVRIEQETGFWIHDQQFQIKTCYYDLNRDVVCRAREPFGLAKQRS